MREYTAVISAGYGLNNLTGKSARIQEVTHMVSSVLKKMIDDRNFNNADITKGNIIIGSHFGRIEFIDRGAQQAARLQLKDYCNPNYFVHSISSAIPGQAAIDHKIGKETITINTAELSGIDAIGYAHCSSLLSDELYFAGGADSAYAMTASGKYKDSRDIRSGAGLVAISNIHSAILKKKPPLAYLSHYKNGAFAENSNGMLAAIVSKLINNHFPKGKRILLITFGAVQPGKDILTDQCSELVDVIQEENLVGITGGAGCALAMALLLSDDKPNVIRERIQFYKADTVVFAGTSVNNSYSHIMMHLNCNYNGYR